MSLLRSLDFLRFSRGGGRRPQAHMTWASSKVGKRITQTGTFLRRELWVWPIFAVLLLAVVGVSVQQAIRSTIKQNLGSGLQTLLSIEVAMLEAWFRVQESNAESKANDKRVRELVESMLAGDAVANSGTTPVTDIQLSLAEWNQELQRELSPLMGSHDYEGFHVIDKSDRILGSSYPAVVGRTGVPEYEAFLTRVFDGETVVCPPFPSVVMMEDAAGKLRAGLPTMYVAAPIRDSDFQVIAALALQIRPEREFTRILQLGQFGSSGETYAFDSTGMMVSNSRFDEDLILLGIIPDHEHSKSILGVHIRDPQQDLTQGFRPSMRRSAMPLTRMAQDAIAGNSNMDLDGYRDYRGVPVVGAWNWLSDYQMGVATEVDMAQAFRPLTILNWAFGILYGLLAMSSLGIFVFSLLLARSKREAQKAEIEAQQLGQYTLSEKLGSGGMGSVYIGHHAMLRRPTAIKLLDVEKMNDLAVERFEREVQITCQLNHPNTIAIYDYGRTPEGVFYYAMEYLDGLDLQTLVDDHGPLPEARVIHILLQICGSLFEAHTRELVHRDIKPANIMLNRRGGVPDVVKVLDFGLVKDRDPTKAAESGDRGLVGTPLYMSPEAIQSPLSVDARSDLYAVGAVGYFLLTGEPVFAAKSMSELIRMQVDEQPRPPSTRTQQPISD
ncbi:MAG: serine/threonine protein kinase, partial [bacterium]|nr:serine/threonine protein kinase [bacterium]